MKNFLKYINKATIDPGKKSFYLFIFSGSQCITFLSMILSIFVALEYAILITIYMILVICGLLLALISIFTAIFYRTISKDLLYGLFGMVFNSYYLIIIIYNAPEYMPTIWGLAIFSFLLIIIL